MTREQIEDALMVHDRALRAAREDATDARMRVANLQVVISALRDMIDSLKAQLTIVDAIERGR